MVTSQLRGIHMPSNGDYFTILLSEANANWGTHRSKDTRKPQQNEIYLPVPITDAKRLSLYNSNYINGKDEFGINLYYYTAYINSKEHSKGILKFQGCSSKGDIYAKNLSGYRNLKMLSRWIQDGNIKVGDTIKILFTSDKSLTLNKLSY